MIKTVFIKSYGCQMNVYDTGRMSDVLAHLGYATAPNAQSADLVILNTCHIREKASEKLFSDLGRLRTLKTQRQESGCTMLLAVAGCVAQAEGAEILRRAPQVDLVFGPQTYHRLPDLITRAERNGTPVIDTELPPEDKFDHLPARRNIRSVSAFVTVQEGCDKFCTFCVVPYTRGAEVSRSVTQVETEARALVQSGVREIVLLGQNVNAYHGRGHDGSWSLARLISHLAKIEGLARIRYTTSHPRDLGADLIEAHGQVPKLMPYLHLPVQSGSDRILQAMNRQHTAEQYAKLIVELRRARPDIAISGDFVVGFPGETEDDFQATLGLVRSVGYASAFSFKYSPRPGTPGAAMNAQVPDEIKSDRLKRLQSLLTEQQRAFNQRFVGRIMQILFEKPGRHPGQMGGRSPYLQAVHVVEAAGTATAGQIHAVEILGADTMSLSGRLAGSRMAAAE